MNETGRYLKSMRLKNVKSFADSTTIEFRRINILIGANNAGKSTFQNVIELFFRSQRSGISEGPLAFDSMPGFTSFDSVLRKHWNSTTGRPSSFEMKFVSSDCEFQFECRSQGTDDTVVVSKAEYVLEGNKEITATRKLDVRSGRASYVLKHPFKARGQSAQSDSWFHHALPLEILRHSPSGIRPWAPFHVEVVNPYRPVPRSFYVLDDPNLAPEDRSLLTYLIRLWSSKDEVEQATRRRLISSLETLGLTKHFEVAQVSKRIGPKVVEIRVAPSSSRQKVTIADAGFGLSQFLPLAIYDARLSRGALIAYQPEVHLHPYAQSRLADVFVESVKRSNQVFVETHSTDMILRLQALIANGAISAGDVCVLCFSNANGKSEIREMRFDENGSPSETWPAGFLDTSLGLARELTRTRLGKMGKSQ